MTVCQLRYGDDPVLHQFCTPIKIVDDEIRAILHDMAETMYHKKNGVGLAACQIGIMKRLVVIDLGQGLLQLVNPEIMETRGARECMEGCLSFPGMIGRTIRPQKVKIKALNAKGNPIEFWGEGDLAMCLCHEIDHLDGIVYPDRATAIYRIASG